MTAGFARILFCVFVAFAGAEELQAQGTMFTYQGRLNDGGSPANGIYDLRFGIYDAVTNGGAIGFPQTNSATAVSNGLFVVMLDFGSGIFTGPDRWLDIGVRTNGGTNFTTLSPRQQLTPAPYAIFANSASNLVGRLSAFQLSGTLPATAFAGYTNTVALTNGANIFSGAFSGNGGGVTNVNVTNLTGVLADNQLPVNTAFLNSNQTFTASNTFNGANTFTNLLGNSFSGSFFGNGLVGWLVVPGTTVQAAIDTGYLLTNSQVVTVTLPASPNIRDIVRIAGAGASGWEIAENANQSLLGNFLSYGTDWIQSGAAVLNWTGIASSWDGTEMAATVHGGNIYISTDSGKSWTGHDSSRQWQAVAMSSDGNKLVAAVTNGGSIYTSTDSGSTWVANSGTGGNWSSVASSSDGNKLVATYYGGGIYTNLGTAWSASGALSPENWSSVASSADGTRLVATVYGGSIYVSSNSGKSWTAGGNTSGKNWISVASSSDGSRLAAVINNGGIYISTNSGSSWVPTSALTKNWASVASSSDGSRLAAVINGGGIYTSGNWGGTWTPQTNAPAPAPTANWSSIASSSDGSKLGATIYNGGIYTSQSSLQSVTTPTTGFITGAQGSAVELQYIGNNQFMPVSSTGTIWGY